MAAHDVLRPSSPLLSYPRNTSIQASETCLFESSLRTTSRGTRSTEHLMRNGERLAVWTRTREAFVRALRHDEGACMSTWTVSQAAWSTCDLAGF